MNSLNISGGATKIAGMFGAVEVAIFDYNYNPDVISGISSGSVLALITAMVKDHEEVRAKTYAKVTDFSLKDFMSKPPFNENGKFAVNAGLRAITGKKSLGVQNKLEGTLSNIISEKLYNEYIKGVDKYPDVVLGTVDYVTGRRKYFNVRREKLSYRDFLKLTNASASIPIAVEPVLHQEYILFDGGVRDHIGTPYMLNRSCYSHLIKDSLNIFSRPKDYRLADTNWCLKGKNIVDVMTRTFDIMNIEISKNDEKDIIITSLEKGINSKIVYLTNHMKSLYDTDNTRLLKSYNEGIKETREQLGIII